MGRRDPLRPPLWREPWVLLVTLFAFIATLYLGYHGWEQRARADEPEIVYGTIEGGGTTYKRYGGRGLKLRVRLESGKRASVDYELQDLSGCERGSTVVLERRRSGLSLASPACPPSADDAP